MKKNQKLVNLIQGIEDLLSESRCPLTDEDKVLLKNCLKELRGIDENSTDSLEIIEKVIKWILLFFDVLDKIKDVF